MRGILIVFISGNPGVVWTGICNLRDAPDTRVAYEHSLVAHFSVFSMTYHRVHVYSNILHCYDLNVS
jgi:hypothetical protein